MNDVVTTLAHSFLIGSSLFLQATSKPKLKLCDGILTKFKLIKALIVVLIVCKNEADPLKIESTRVVATFSPLEVYMDFSKCSRAGNS